MFETTTEIRMLSLSMYKNYTNIIKHLLYIIVDIINIIKGKVRQHEGFALNNNNNIYYYYCYYYYYILLLL